MNCDFNLTSESKTDWGWGCLTGLGRELNIKRGEGEDLRTGRGGKLNEPFPDIYPRW